jgi:hypothetical protein
MQKQATFKQMFEDLGIIELCQRSAQKVYGSDFKDYIYLSNIISEINEAINKTYEKCMSGRVKKYTPNLTKIDLDIMNDVWMEVSKLLEEEISEISLEGRGNSKDTLMLKDIRDEMFEVFKQKFGIFKEQNNELLKELNYGRKKSK